eukprot:6191703-Pleurochrysis_carterae.AAC.2
MQGNFFAGQFLRMSMVPPCVVTGVNFGSTAFLTSLSALAERGMLGDNVYRQTDSGPDNDAKETHALHCHLVHCGVVNKIVWLRLIPKHSHNLADRYHGMVKEKVCPNREVGGGCMAPWDMEGIVDEALVSQKGQKELAWHWANWGFKSYYADHIAAGFHDYADQRLWEYENAPSMSTQGGVRVTYRPDILPLSDPNIPDMRPVETGQNGAMRTKKEGKVFMSSFPSIASPPPMEAWKPADVLSYHFISSCSYSLTAYIS